MPVSDNSILAELEALLGSASIAESKRIEFFQGKRKLKDGTTKKTGNYYWEYRWKSPDPGTRKAKYGGGIETVPARYWQRAERYKAALDSRGIESLADGLFRPAIIRVQDSDTGTG